MDQVVPVESRASKRYTRWSGVALAVGLAVILTGSSGQLLLWAVPALLTNLPGVAAATAMLLLPGLALLRLCWSAPLHPAERWALALGVSSALPPLLLLASEPVGVRWNTQLCWGYLAVATAVLLWPIRGRPTQEWRTLFTPLDREHLLIIAITVAAVVLRLYVVRDLPAGMWGDSYHHTVIAQLLVDNGGLFSSWQPYAPLKTFTYHYGLHSNVAWLSWLSDMPATRSLLVVGQLHSALAAPLAYLLTRRLLGNRAAALWAALLVGLLVTMPSYYVNWGRYTQLAGQTVLIAVGVVWMALLDQAVKRPVARSSFVRLLVLAVLTTAGLALTHYRVGIFAACFVAAYALYLLIMHVRSPVELVRLAGTGILAGGLTLLTVLPWLLRLREGKLLLIGGYFASQNIGTSQLNVVPPIDDIFFHYTSPFLLPLALIGVGLLVRRRQWGGLVLVLWAGLVWLAANPYLVGLPGAGLITNFAVVIAGYLVLAPLAGAAIALISAWPARVLPQDWPIIPAQLLVVASLSVWGIGYQQQIVEPEYQLLTPADVEAMAWIRRETPSDATFFVNSFPAYGDTLYAGSDGGWWLAFLSGRPTNLPPLLYGSEAGEQPGYARAVYELNAALQRHPLDSPDTVAALREAGYHYLYDGPAANPAEEYIDPDILARSPFYDVVYRNDGVTIWSVR